MKEKIGQAAGEIWKVLGEKGQVGISRLPDIARMKADIAYQALGWLAHENKVDYNTKDGKTFVSLTPFESNIHKANMQKVMA